MFILRNLITTFLFVWLLSACASYEAAPLDVEAVLASEVRQRAATPPDHALTLADAVASMRARNPRLREAWAVAAIDTALAQIPTPLPNPSLSAGPLFLSGADILESSRGVEVALGWSVLLSGTRGIRDDINEVRARASSLAAAGVEREEYLALRADLCALVLTTRRLDARRDILATLRLAVEIGRRLIEAAQATALDLRMLELELVRQEAAVLAEESAVLEARTKLAARAGLALAAIPDFRPDLLAVLPDSVPLFEELQQVMLRDHPLLNTLRARYLVAEHSLKLEVARQFPAFGLGASLERESDVDRLGFPVEFELPLFDRNQQGIATAQSGRTAVRIQFEAAVGERLGSIEGLRAKLLLAQRRLELLRTRTAPVSTQTIALARQALAAGGVDSLRFLEVLRADREVRLDLVAAELDVYDAWTDLEQACGSPLLVFPHEPGIAPSDAASPKENS